MRLEDIMRTNVKTIKSNVSADVAFERMKLQDLHHLVVRDNGGVLGVLSQRDLGGARGASLRKNSTVSDLMSKQIITAKTEDSVRQAANKLRGYGVGCLPVMKDGKLKGILTITDMLELIGRGVERPEQRTKRALRKRKQGGHVPYKAR